MVYVGGTKTNPQGWEAGQPLQWGQGDNQEGAGAGAGGSETLVMLFLDLDDGDTLKIDSAYTLIICCAPFPILYKCYICFKKNYRKGEKGLSFKYRCNALSHTKTEAKEWGPLNLLLLMHGRQGCITYFWSSKLSQAH